MNQSLLLEPKKEFKTEANKEYEVEAIVDSAVYSHEVENQLLSLYYLIL